MHYMAPHSVLESLPIELIVKTFRYLSLRDYFVVLRLSRFFHDVCTSSLDLQYHMSLKFSGYVDGSKAVSTRDKFKELKRRENAWDILDLTRKVSVKVPFNVSHIYDLCGGTYLLGDCKNQIHTRDTYSLGFFDLSSCDGMSGILPYRKGWRELDFGTQIVDIGFSIREHDLVAIIDYEKQSGDELLVRLRLHEHSTGCPHPFAENPVIHIMHSKRTWGKLSIMIEISGPSLLLLLSWHSLGRGHVEMDDVLYLINWWSGEILAVEHGGTGSYTGFIFLTPELVLLPDMSRKVLEILKLPDVMKKNASPASSLERVALLELPKMKSACTIMNVASRSDPNPCGIPHPSLSKSGAEAAGWKTVRQRPFYPDPEHAMVVIAFFIIEFEQVNNQFRQWRHDVTLVFHRDTVVKTLDELDVLKINDPRPQSVPWSAWGLKKARWLAHTLDHGNWITISAGQRLVGISDEGQIVVKDFNPNNVLKISAKQGDKFIKPEDYPLETPFITDYISGEEEETLDAIFDIDYRDLTNLPYVQTLSKDPAEYESVLLEEERIIGLKISPATRTVTEFDVLTL